MKKQKYWSPEKILSAEAHYNIVISGRSDGKTVGVESYGLSRYMETGEQMAIIRRWGEDIKASNAMEMFNGIVGAGLLKSITGGKWEGVYYYSRKFYLCRWEDEKRITDDTPFCFIYAISEMEHTKSSADQPNVRTVLFDEFITRNTYLPNEFVLFTNLLSSIVRERGNVKIFMLGNTVTKFCPYFNEMGLIHVQRMKPGDMDIYTYGDSDLRVAVELPQVAGRQKRESNVLFAFDNPHLQMITNGSWEMAIYPHLPPDYDWKPSEVIGEYFIIFDGNTLHAEIVCKGTDSFTFIHRKTTPIKHPDTDIIFTPGVLPGRNNHRRITAPRTGLERRIWEYFKRDKVFYSENEVGEIVRAYIVWSNSAGGVTG